MTTTWRSAAAFIAVAIAVLIGTATPAAAAHIANPYRAGYGRALATTQASTIVTVPALTCGPVDGRAVFAATVLPESANAIGSAVMAICELSQASYRVAFAKAGTIETLAKPISAGNRVYLDVRRATVTTWKLTVRNITKNWTVTRSIPYVAAVEFAIAVERAADSIPQFANAFFSNATVNGAALGTTAPNRYTMRQGDITNAVALAIQNSRNFTVVWKHA